MEIRIDRLKEIASAVLSAAEAPRLEESLEHIAEISRELVKAKYAALGIPDGKGGLRYFKTTGITPEQRQMIPHFPKGLGLIGALMREKKAIRLEHMRDDPRSVGFPAHHPPMDSFLGVPIQLNNQLFGMLYLADREDGQPFDEDDEWLVETLAGYAALAIVSAELVEGQAHLRAMEERERIAMELHDGVIQSLYAIGIQMQVMRAKDSVQVDDMTPLVEGLNDVIDEIRGYIAYLTYRDEQVATVYDSFSQLRGRLHLPDETTLVIDAPQTQPPVSPVIFEGICLMVNEALSNAIRHANASRIHLKASHRTQYFIVEINDDGRGFDVGDTMNNRGLGLKNMVRRAHIYGGDVAIDSTPGQGTHVTIQIPLGL